MSKSVIDERIVLDDSLIALLKTKLGLDAFKEVGDFHIRIKEGKANEKALRAAILVCPAGLYSEDKNGEIMITEDGCLECGTCKIACTDDLLDWRYPDAMCGVQYRFG